MSEPVNLFAVDPDRFPVGSRVLGAMAALGDTFDKLWPALHFLAEHVGQTSAGLALDGVPIQDDEMAFHALALQQIGATLEELLKKVGVAETMNEQRMWTVLTNRGSMGTVAFGKTFKAIGDVIPKVPPHDSPEYDELIEWCREHYPEYVKKPEVGFQNMQKILDDRMEKKLPRPPHVDIAPRTGIKIGK